ncbi:MAG: amino acid permease [Caldilineaceae bacterium]
MAIGLTITVGLGVFTLMGVFVTASTRNIVGAFLLAAVVALPFLATYVERALVVPGREGVYSLVRTSSVLWHRFITGWLLLGGYAVLIALLGYGMALYLELFLGTVLNQETISVKLLTVLAIAVAAPLVLFATGAQWRRRTVLVLTATVFVVVLVIGRAWTSNMTVPLDTVFTMQTYVLRISMLIGATYWGLLLLVDMRGRVRRPLKTLPPSLATVLAVGAVLGALVGWALLKTPTALVQRDVPLYGLIAGAPAFGQTGLWVLALIVLGVGINLLGITQVMVAGARLLHAMTEDGFMPTSARFLSPGQAPTTATVVVGGVLGALLFLLLSPPTLTALAALLFFWSSFMIHIPDVLRSKPNLADSRRFKLPFHPLIPGFVVVISALATLLLTEGVLFASGWLAVGLVAYFAYGRAHAEAIRREQTVVADSDAAAHMDRFRAMVCVSNPDTALDLVRFGQTLAQARDGEVLVLRVMVSRTSLTTPSEREDADDQHRFLAAVLAGLEDDGPEPRAIVRLAPSLADGILESIREEACDLVLVGGSGRLRGRAASEDILNLLLSYAPCDVAVLHGTFAPEQGRILVATAGGRHATYGFALARSLCAHAACDVRVITVADNARDDADELAEQALHTCMGDAYGEAVVLRDPAPDAAKSDDDGDAAGQDDAAEDAADDGEPDAAAADDAPLVAQVVRAASVSSGIMDAAEEADLLILGAPSTAMLERPVYNGLALEIATETPQPTLIVRRHAPALAGTRPCGGSLRPSDAPPSPTPGARR